MENIELTSETNDIQFRELETIWQASPNAYISITAESVEEKNKLAAFLLSKLPSDLAVCVLADLAESEDLDDSLTLQIFKKGDTACKVAIALRENLSSALHKLCERENNPAVAEHFKQKHLIAA